MTDGNDIQRLQLERLQRMLAVVSESNAFYRPRLAGRTIASLEDFTQNVDFTTKQQIIEDQQAHPPAGSNLSCPLDQYSRFHQSSATTAAPMRWLDTAESWQWVLDNWKIVYDAADVTDTDRIFFAFSFGPFLGFWSAFEAASQIGSLCIPGGGMSSLARLRAICDNDATVICCTPTYALHLAQTAADNDIDLAAANVRRIIVAGEPGGSLPATRQRIETGFPGARVFDHHGMTEVGPVTYECPAEPGVLHIIESSYLAEVIEGELILTTLGRDACPLLRYRTGDLVNARPRGQCRCGRYDLALEGGILGRADDMVLVRGVNVFPSAVDQILRRFEAVAEYRVEITSDQSLTQVRVMVEPTDGDGSTLCQEVQDALRAAFNLRIDVQPAEPGSLPRFEMKAKRWIRT